MQRRDLIIGIVVLAVIAGIVLFIQRRRQELSVPLVSPSPTPSLEQQERSLENRFNVTIPDDVEKTTLKDVKGLGFSGIATRDFTNSTFNLTVLADIPDPESGKFYQVWLTKNGQNRLMGTMRAAKGGFLLDTSLGEDLTSFNGVVVSLESKNDLSVEEVTLKGTF